MENLSKRHKHIFYILVLIPITFLLLSKIFQADFDIRPYYNFPFLVVKYFTYLYFLIPSTVMRLLYKQPFSKVFTMRISLLHLVILVFWLLLANFALFGTDENYWPSGELFLTQFFAANVAFYFILTLPTLDYQRPRTPGVEEIRNKQNKNW